MQQSKMDTFQNLEKLFFLSLHCFEKNLDIFP
jgi:hypothetical protein